MGALKDDFAQKKLELENKTRANLEEKAAKSRAELEAKQQEQAQLAMSAADTFMQSIEEERIKIQSDIDAKKAELAASGIGQITAEDLAELDEKVKATQDAKRAQNTELTRKKEEMEAALAAKKGDGTSQQRDSVMEQMDHAIMDKAIAQQQAEEKQLQADKERRKEASHDKMQAKLAARKAKQNKKKADEEVEVVVKSKASGPARGGDTTAQGDVEQSRETDLDTREAEFQ